jgi:hypothetical protein
MDYIDFHLKIGPRVAENQYAVVTRSPSIGETRGVFTRPLTDEQLELFVLRVGLARRGVRRLHSPEWRAAQDFGQKLFRSLFTDEIRAAYLASHNDAVRQGKGLRVKLTLDAPELANYPWELLYDPSNSQFLSLFEDTPVLRYIELPRPILPLAVAPPLRLLALASSPKDYEPLNLAQERRNLSQALDALLKIGLIELDWLQTATLEALREQLLQRPYHIFHFIGHGGFDEREQDGILIFENANQYANRVSGERLAVILGNHRTLRLAVLNACEGARTSEQDPFAGTAMTLGRTGNLPAVIAMQFEITDTAAIDFASGFYSAIAAGRPVDAAVSQGRQAIFAHDNDVEWSTPVLYLRAADGVIFRVDTRRAAADAQRVAAAQAEQERLAREKLDAERIAAEQAERERREQLRLEQERAEQERLAQRKADAARVEQERAANVPPSHQVPERATMRVEQTRPSHMPEAFVSQTEKQSARNLFVLSGIFLAFGSSFVGTGSLALLWASEELPRLRLAGVVMTITALLLGALGVWILGLAASRRIALERISFWILVLGSLAGTLLGIFGALGQWETLGTFVIIGLVVGGSIALAVWASNRRLTWTMLGIVAAGWLIGFVIQGAVTTYLYPSLLESVWDWLVPLMDSVGDKPLYVLQIGIIGLFVGAIAPLIGIAVLERQLRYSLEN